MSRIITFISINLYGGLETKTRNTLRASAFPEKPRNRCLGRCRSLRQCNRPELTGHKKKQKAPNNILKIDDPPNFQKKVANGPLEKPLATATVIFEFGDNIIAEHFVAMQKLTGPIIALHLLTNNNVVIDKNTASYISHT